MDNVKSTFCAIMGLAVLVPGVAFAVAYATDVGSGATTEWEATSIGGGLPYLTGHDGLPTPYGIPYGGSGITFTGPVSPAGAEDLIFVGDMGVDPDFNAPWGSLGVGIQRIDGSFSIGTAGSVSVLSLYFLGNSGALWVLDFTPVTGLYTYSGQLTWASGWYDTSFLHGSGDFATDITNTVSQVGFRVAYNAGYPSAPFGITDITLDDNQFDWSLVPEPQTYAMLGMALVSLGVTFRRRLNSAVDSVRSKIIG